MTLAPSTATASSVQLFTDIAVDMHDAGAALRLVSQPTWVPVSPSFSRSRSHSSIDGSTSTLIGLPLRTKLMFMGTSPFARFSASMRATSTGQVASTTSPTPNGLLKNFRSDT